MNAESGAPAAPAAEPDDSRSLLAELRRKFIHLTFIVLPLELLYAWLPWPRTRSEFRIVFLVMVVVAVTVDLLRIHEQRVRGFFREFFGQMIREHEQFSLLGSTYLLLAALLAIEIFPLKIAAAALGFTVLGDASAAIVGCAWGRHRLFRKSVEGALGGLVVCLAWAAYLAVTHRLPWPVVIVGAVVASLVELLPIPLDDNLGMTLAAGYAMKLLLTPGAHV